MEKRKVEMMVMAGMVALAPAAATMAYLLVLSSCAFPQYHLVYGQLWL